MDKIITIRGSQSGKTLTIMGGIHGNEICGVEVVKELREKLKINRGTVYLILGNPRAIKDRVRQTDTNLNRAFREVGDLTREQINSYEYKLAKEIMPYLQKSDAVLDLHSSGTEDSPPFVICENNAHEIVRYFPFTRITSGWDPLEPGGTDAYVDKYGGKGICVECGNHNDPEAIATARTTAEIFLKVMGAIDGADTLEITKGQEFIQMSDIYITKNNFALACKFDDFAEIKKGEAIGFDGTDKLCAPKDCYLLFARERLNQGEEAYLLGTKLME